MWLFQFIKIIKIIPDYEKILEKLNKNFRDNPIQLWEVDKTYAKIKGYYHFTTKVLLTYHVSTKIYRKVYFTTKVLRRYQFTNISLTTLKIY